MSQDDFVWVKLIVKNWDAPNCPLDLPDVAEYDAAAIPRLRPCDVPAATRESATCEACLQTRRGRRQTIPHSLVWGECLRAPRPLAEEAAEDGGTNAIHLQQPRFEDVDPENRPQTPSRTRAHRVLSARGAGDVSIDYRYLGLRTVFGRVYHGPI